MFFVLSGPSGVGKSSIVEQLLSFYTHLQASISYTTRSPRKKSDGSWEIDGVDYYFVTENKFDRLKENDELLEYTYRYGAQYGTGKNELQRLKDASRDMLLDLDTTGGLKVKELYPQDTILIFIEPPSLAELEERLRYRNSGDNIETRMAEAEEQIRIGRRKYDYVVTNISLSSAVAEVANKVIRPVLIKRFEKLGPDFEEEVIIPAYDAPERCIYTKSERFTE